jgi:hypothetical protein
MLMLMPSVRRRSIAGQPSFVPGTLIIRFGRSTSDQRRRASAMVFSVSRASVGETSSDTKPSRPAVASYTGRKRSAAWRTSSTASRSKISRSLIRDGASALNSSS